MRSEAEREPLLKDVIRMTFKLAGRLLAHMDRCAGELDLTPMQARALFVTNVPVAMRHLAEALHCDASNVTGIVDRLEERGLMERVVDEEDRRRKNLVVTTDGREVTEQLKSLLREGNPILDLTDDELLQLHGLLMRVLSQGVPSEPAGHHTHQEPHPDALAPLM